MLTGRTQSNGGWGRWSAFAGLAALAGALAFSAVPAGAAETASSAPAPGSLNAPYKLAAGDVVRITVYQSPDLSVETRLTETGAISYPLLGNVQLGDLTVSQAEKRISDGLKTGNFVKQPQVAILVTQVRGHQVSVLGQVGRPGRYPLETGDVRLTDLIATAGGIASTGSDIIVVVGTRDGKPFRAEVDLPTVFSPKGRGDDLIVRNGDVIWLERAPTIYIYGEVQRPGNMRLERGMSVLQALAASGGVTQRGTERGLKVHRQNPATGKIEIIQPSMTDLLQPNDVVYVRESVF